MKTKCLNIGKDIVTAELTEIDIDQAGSYAVKDISQLEVDISIPIITTKLKVIPQKHGAIFMIFNNLTVRHIQEKLTNATCSVSWKIDSSSIKIMHSPLKTEVLNFYLSLFEASYYITITMGVYEQITHGTGLNNRLFDVFEKGFAIQALKAEGLNIEEFHLGGKLP